MFNRIKTFYYYSKSRNLASQDNFLDALDYLIRIPIKTKNVYTYLLEGFLQEKLGNLNASLFAYDKARSLVEVHKKVNTDEKLYIISYIEYGYANIYMSQGKNQDSNKFVYNANLNKYNTSNIKKFILEDFPIVKGKHRNS